MPSKHALNVSLTEQLCEFVADQVDSGRFRTASEVVRAGLRLLQQELTPSQQVKRQISRTTGRQAS